MAMPPAPHPYQGPATGRPPRLPWGRYVAVAAVVAAVLVAIAVVRIVAADDSENLRTSDGLVYERTLDESTYTLSGPVELFGTAFLDANGACVGGPANYLDLDTMTGINNQVDAPDADLPPSVTVVYARCDAAAEGGPARGDRSGLRIVAGRAVAGVVDSGDPSVEQCRTAARQRTIPDHVTVDMLRSDPRFAKGRGWCFETVGKTVVHLKVFNTAYFDTPGHLPAFAFVATQWKPRAAAAR